MGIIDRSETNVTFKYKISRKILLAGFVIATTILAIALRQHEIRRRSYGIISHAMEISLPSSSRLRKQRRIQHLLQGPASATFLLTMSTRDARLFAETLRAKGYQFLDDFGSQEMYGNISPVMRKLRSDYNSIPSSWDLQYQDISQAIFSFDNKGMSHSFSVFFRHEKDNLCLVYFCFNE